MTNEMFKKEAFKKSVKDNVKFLYRKTIEEATQEQIFQAVSYSVKDVIIDNWLATQKAYDEQDPKIVYYMSMEFLMGRALGNNLINLCAYGEVKEALEELGFDLNCIEDQEPDIGQRGQMVGFGVNRFDGHGVSPKSSWQETIVGQAAALGSACFFFVLGALIET